MLPAKLIQTHFGGKAAQIMLAHSRKVTVKALKCAGGVRSLQPDMNFLKDAAMLHDIGCCLVHAPQIGLYGKEPYIRHGVIGRQILEGYGLLRHALVAERHIGAGITIADIRRLNLPLPGRDMRPRSIEEIIVAYADKFYSKTSKGEKNVTEIVNSLEKFGKARTFLAWHRLLGSEVLL